MKHLRPLLLAVAVLAGLVAWWSHRQTVAATEAISQLQSTRRDTEARVHELAERLARAQQTSTDLRARPSAASAVKTAPPAPAPAPHPARDLSRLIDDDPKLQNLQLASRRSQFAITYGPFYRRASLTPAQIAAFEENLLRREERQADVLATATAQHADLRESVYQKLYGEIDADYQAAQREALGDSASKAFSDYERSADSREMVSALAGAAAMANAPLDATQTEQLARVITDVKASQLARALAAVSSTPGAMVSSPALDWDLVREQAKSFLSPTQLTFIETTEPSGPRGGGGRFLPALQAAIASAAKDEPATP